MATPVTIRAAVDGDLSAIADIYNREVRTGTATFDTQPVTLEERRAWLRGHDPARHPVIVAERGQILGFASLSEWSNRCAYARAAEVSIYVHIDARGRGVGRRLLAGLIERARSGPIEVLLARIVAGSAASIRLHQSFGFGHIGTMRRVGQKFGKILDVELYDLHLDEPVALEEPEGS